MPAKFGFATALILAGFYRLATLWNPVIFLPPAIVFPVAAFGIRKGIAWSGYGGALFLDALVGGLIVGTARFPNPGVTWGALAFILVLAACAGFLLVWLGVPSPGRQSSSSKPAWIALAAATLLSLVILRPFVIPTGAMEDTLLIGDYVLVRVVGASSPSRGDLVAFRYPVDPKQIFVKRVVATGGDRLRIKDKKLFVKGVPQNEPYALSKTSYIDSFRDNLPSEANVTLFGSWGKNLQSSIVGDELMVPPGKALCDGRQSRFLTGQPLLGIPRPEEHHRKTGADLFLCREFHLG
jgi:signal peptidase I